MNVLGSFSECSFWRAFLKQGLLFFLVSFCLQGEADAQYERLIYKFQKRGSGKVIFLTGSNHDSVPKGNDPWLKKLHEIFETQNIRTYFREKMAAHASTPSFPAVNLEDKIIHSFLESKLPGIKEKMGRHFDEMMRFQTLKAAGLTLAQLQAQVGRPAYLHFIAKLNNLTQQIFDSPLHCSELFQRQANFIHELTGVVMGGVDPLHPLHLEANPFEELKTCSCLIPELKEMALSISGEAFDRGADEISLVAHEVALKLFPTELVDSVHAFHLGKRNPVLVETLDQYYEKAPDSSGILAFVGGSHLLDHFGFSGVVRLLQETCGYELIDTVRIPYENTWDPFMEPRAYLERLQSEMKKEVSKEEFEKAIQTGIKVASYGMIHLDLAALEEAELQWIRALVLDSLYEVVRLEINLKQWTRAQSTLDGILQLGLVQVESEEITFQELKEEVSKDTQTCGNCRKTGNSLQICSSCKSIHYCNRDCQKAHWKTHQSDCKKDKTK